MKGNIHHTAGYTLLFAFLFCDGFNEAMPLRKEVIPLTSLYKDDCLDVAVVSCLVDGFLV